MPVRFCAECGTRAAAGGKFCVECGTPLARKDGAAGWKMSAVGSAVLGAFLVAGLAIWTAILSPTPPRPGPGATAARPAAAPLETAAAGDLPEGHPKVDLPAEVKTFITDLSAKAKAEPREVATWLRLAQVNLRAAQIDPAYSPAALDAFRHVLELEPGNAEALRGAANTHYDRNEPSLAIPYYERFLATHPDDASARTDLGTMYLSAGDAARAVATYKDVIGRNPSFLQAHYNLGVTYARQGDSQAALAELGEARRLATEDTVRRQIDQMIAHLKGGAPPPEDGGPAGGAGGPRAEPSPFQVAVEESVRAHPIMGPRIVRFEWTGPAAGRVLVRDFPMEGMPPEVRAKFVARLGEALRAAGEAHPVEQPARLDIADVATGRVMQTLTP